MKYNISLPYTEMASESDQEYEDIDLNSEGNPHFTRSPSHRPPVPIPGASGLPGKVFLYCMIVVIYNYYSIDKLKYKQSLLY